MRGFSLAAAEEADSDAARVRQVCAHGIARSLGAAEHPEVAP